MATYYVATTGNDGNGGTNPTTDAKLTLAGALALVADGDTVEIVAGSYSGQTNIVLDGISCTVQPYSSGAVTLTSTGSAWTILFTDAASTGTITFKDLTINVGDSTREYPVYHLAQKNVTFEGCTFALKEGDSHAVFAITGTNSTSRTIRMDDCTVTMSANSRAVVNVDDGNFYASGGTWTMANSLYPAVHCDDAIGICELDGVTITGTLAYVFGNAAAGAPTSGHFRLLNCNVSGLNAQVFGLDTIDSIYCVDNTLAALASNASRAVSLVSTNGINDYVYMRGNTCTDWSGFVSIGSNCEIMILDNTCTVTGGTASGLLQFGADDWGAEDPEANVLADLKRNCICIGNEITRTATVGDVHACFLGMGYAAIVFTDNKVVNRGTQNLFGCVVKACGASVCGNVFDVYKVGMYLAGACGCLVRDNVFNTVADTSSLMFDDTGRNPVSNVVMNNVFSSEHASTVAVNFQDLTDVFNNYIDYNWFETSSVRFNNTTYASLAAAEAAQSAYTTRGGDALQDHCVFGQEAAVQVGASYRPGNGRAYLDAHPAVGGQAQAFGPFQQKRRTSKWLLLPT